MLTKNVQRPVQQNGFVESFNGRLRDEFLNETLFGSLTEARRIIEAWRIDYNTERPHTSLKGLIPNAFEMRSKADRNQNGLYLSTRASRVQGHYERAQSGAGPETIQKRILLSEALSASHTCSESRKGNLSLAYRFGCSSRQRAKFTAQVLESFFSRTVSLLFGLDK